MANHRNYNYANHYAAFAASNLLVILKQNFIDKKLTSISRNQNPIFKFSYYVDFKIWLKTLKIGSKLQNLAVSNKS